MVWTTYLSAVSALKGLGNVRKTLEMWLMKENGGYVTLGLVE